MVLKLKEEKVFNLKNWRNLVQNTAEKTIGSLCQTIVPFGFEVTGQKEYLGKNLNRFYCYFALPQLKTKSLKTEECFAHELLKEIKLNDKQFYDQISVVVYEHDKRKVELFNNLDSNSILINIEQRIIEDELILDYASYLACTLFESENKTLPEYVRAKENLNVRNRLYQIYLIIEYATQYINIPFTTKEKYVFDMLHTLKKSKITHYYTSVPHIQATLAEEEYLKIIEERLHKIFVKVNEEKETVHVNVKAYNSDGIIDENLPVSYLSNFMYYVKKSYIEFI